MVTLEGEPWFAAKDACDLMGIGNSREATKRLSASQSRLIKKSDVSSLDVTFPNRGLVFVSESGLYALILRSDKPEALDFQDWVTRTVLPAIRKDGSYVMGEEKSCKVLGLKSVSTSLNNLQTLEVKRQKLTTGRGASSKLINESGLYKLIMRSNKSEAEAFQNWVTGTVLPAIRKDGSYVMGEEKSCRALGL
ncbi:BRO family protein [Pseudooceanicola sp. HF7]|uniref:BRO-N domain-containing protein n=1 Tax=Pseudooceanicola sp. HF7 TaxID=2721560 RepID=UPI0014313F39|nr:BRO family protein [Pseudooceanicola sp. HF7]